MPSKLATAFGSSRSEKDAPLSFGIAGGSTSETPKPKTKVPDIRAGARNLRNSITENYRKLTRPAETNEHHPALPLPKKVEPEPAIKHPALPLPAKKTLSFGMAGGNQTEPAAPAAPKAPAAPPPSAAAGPSWLERIKALGRPKETNEHHPALPLSGRPGLSDAENPKHAPLPLPAGRTKFVPTIPAAAAVTTALKAPPAAATPYVGGGFDVSDSRPSEEGGLGRVIPSIDPRGEEYGIDNPPPPGAHAPNYNQQSGEGRPSTPAVTTPPPAPGKPGEPSFLSQWGIPLAAGGAGLAGLAYWLSRKKEEKKRRRKIAHLTWAPPFEPMNAHQRFFTLYPQLAKEARLLEPEPTEYQTGIGPSSLPYIPRGTAPSQWSNSPGDELKKLIPPGTLPASSEELSTAAPEPRIPHVEATMTGGRSPDPMSLGDQALVAGRTAKRHAGEFLTEAKDWAGGHLPEIAGGAAGLTGLAGLAYWLHRKKQQKRRQQKQSSVNSLPLVRSWVAQA